MRTSVLCERCMHDRGMLVAEKSPSRWLVNKATKFLSQALYELFRNHRSTLCEVEALVSF
jgi:hypothetical protein